MIIDSGKPSSRRGTCSIDASSATNPTGMPLSGNMSEQGMRRDSRCSVKLVRLCCTTA
jgi:hypothetical protein